jgi:hypothetical protein
MDIDIISRIHDHTSKSIHIGTFFNQLNAWYVLFYLKDLNYHLPTSITPNRLLCLVDNFVEIGKFKVTDKADNISDYSRFQSTSNQRR